MKTKLLASICLVVLLVACSKKDLSITDNAGPLTEEIATDIPNHGERI